jgi:hypothetical protein
MIKALAPRILRGSSWVCLSIAWLCMASAEAQAQARAKTDPPAAKKADAKAAAKKDNDQTDDEAKPDDQAKTGAAATDKSEKEKEAEAAEIKPSTTEIFRDGVVQKILDASYRPEGRSCGPEAPKHVREMASGTRPVDRTTIQTAVDGMIYVLSSTRTSVLAEPAEKRNQTSVRNFRAAVQNLTTPIDDARKAKNDGFLTVYSEVLVDSLKKLLHNNFYARVEASIILSELGSDRALNVFTTELADKNQTIWVKMAALKGLARIAKDGTRELPPTVAADASKAIAAFLKGNEDLPWPVQMRALEALGSMRVAKPTTARGDLDYAVIAMELLANKDVKPEVRAWAAWALGMMKIDASKKYNFQLVAYHIGDLAAELGEKANESFKLNPAMTEHWTGLLLYQVFPALDGVENARESGLTHVPLNHPSIGPAQKFIRELDAMVKPVARAAVDLLRAPKGQYDARQKDLAHAVDALRTYLDKNVPKESTLWPNGPEFPAKAKEAVAAAARP